MPIVNGPIGPFGAVLDVEVGVNTELAADLIGVGRPVPPPVYVKAMIDTGASVSAFSKTVFDSLSLLPVDRVPILTPSTPTHQPHLADLYHVHLSIVANGSPRAFQDFYVIVAEGWHPLEQATALIGRDILALCLLNYHGLDGVFTLSF